MNLLENIIINGVIEAEKEFFIKYNRPNTYYHKILQ